MNARIAIIFPIGEFTVDFNMFSGLSIAFMVSADVILMPGEALIKIISVKHQKEYGNVKTAVDASLVVLAVIVSLIFLNTIYGVSEGTLIAAFTIGNFSRFFRGYTNKMVREAAVREGYSNLPMVTVDGPDRIYEDGGILYEDGVITHVGDGGNIIPRCVFMSRPLPKALLFLPEQP